MVSTSISVINTTSPTVTTEASTTTNEVVTTTTEPVTTTSAPAASGPYWVVSSSGLLGYGDGDTWTPADSDSDVPTGAEYQVLDLDGVMGTAVGGPLKICEPSQTPLVILDPPLSPGPSGPAQLGIMTPDWDPVPNPVDQIQDPGNEILAEANAFLDQRGLGEAVVTQYLVFDLDSDGTDEELLVARNIPDENLFGTPDSYSLVLMRKQLDVDAGILIVEFSQGAPDNAYVLSHTVTAVADLNGDGQSEIVIDADYYEGAGTTAYEWINDDLGLVAALSGGCGA